MGQPTPPATLEAPARLPVVKLWATLLGPVLAVLVAIIMVSLLSIYAKATPTSLGFALWLPIPVGVACWAEFNKLIYTRYRGSTCWILAFSYPLVQVFVCLMAIVLRVWLFK